MLYRQPLLGLPIYRLGVVVTEIAAALTLVSMVAYLRAAWPELEALISSRNWLNMLGYLQWS